MAANVVEPGTCLGTRHACIACQKTYESGLTLCEWVEPWPVENSDGYYNVVQVGELCEDCAVVHWARSR